MLSAVVRTVHDSDPYNACFFSSQHIAMLRCELDSEKIRAEKAEADASKLKDENYHLREELVAKVLDIRELRAKNKDLQARLDAV
jgi:predicted  nucleic acid-binding Zn-ribbon protein